MQKLCQLSQPAELGHVSKESDKPYLSMEEQMLKECPLDFSLVGQKYWEEGDDFV